MNYNDAVEDKLNALGRVARVDAPPFLYTRVLQRIRNIEPDKVSPKWVWATALGLACVLLLNTSVLTGIGSNEHKDVQGLAAGMQLNNSNDLYR